jgi:hypothetical protein
MTKLEQKLLELGYAVAIYDYSTECTTFMKSFNLYFEIHLLVNNYNEVVDYYVYINDRVVRTQSHINEEQQAFNQLQSDLEVLKQVENNN